MSKEKVADKRRNQSKEKVLHLHGHNVRRIEKIRDGDGSLLSFDI